MGKLDKKDKLNIFCICLIYLSVALIITRGEFVFGSIKDWGFQHIAFPEYFRILFYDTLDLFPDFAFNIGAGQNIYYFAYYGLFSPVILFSYLLPFISMGVYIPFIMLLIGVISIYLFYFWIKGFGFDKKICFILCLMFAMAGPLLFHSHRHIMFVSYMPFLLLGLIGVRRYFDYNYKGLMIISVFLMIITSYYYSVGGIICLTIYGIYEHLKRSDKFNFKDFLKKGFYFALYIIIGILLSSFLLFPVIYALMNGRSESISEVSFLEALISKIDLEFILYDSYGVGLLAISLIAILYLIFKNKEKRFLGVILSLFVIFPIFVYILNGFLYLDGKALIPFLPLYVLATGFLLKDLFSGNLNFRFVIYIILFCLIFVFLNNDSLKFYFLIDVIITILTLFLYKKYKKDLIVLLILAVFSVGVCLNENLADELISISDFQKQNDPEIALIMEDISKSDDGVYRSAINLKASREIVNHTYHINNNLTTLYSSTYNTFYNKFFYNFNNNRASRNEFVLSEEGNSLFESLMGVKYLITDKKAPYGYKVWKKYDNYTVYINENALPIGYVTDRVMSYDDYNDLKFPDDSLSLFGNVIASDGDYEYESKAEKVNLDFSSGKSSNLDISSYKDGYKVVVNDDSGSLKLKVDEGLYLFRMTLENPQECALGDTYISVNGVMNKLTCKSWKYFNDNYTFDYTLFGDTLNIKFSEGTHYIKKIELYIIDGFDSDVSAMENVEVFGDKLTGTINSNGGYLILSIPYDKGFTVKVDGKEVLYEKVNTSFIGFKVSSGKHDIEITFDAPNAFIGKIVSLISFGLLCFIILYDRIYYTRGDFNG